MAVAFHIIYNFLNSKNIKVGHSRRFGSLILLRFGAVYGRVLFPFIWGKMTFSVLYSYIVCYGRSPILEAPQWYDVGYIECSVQMN